MEPEVNDLQQDSEFSRMNDTYSGKCDNSLFDLKVKTVTG